MKRPITDPELPGTDNPMTGGGAVVREQAQDAAVAWQDFTDYHGHTRTPCGPLGNLARAYLAKAAEIERLNDKLIEWQKEWYGWRSRLEASKACTADLLKAAEGVVESLALGPLDMAAKYGPDVSPEQIQNYALDTLAAAIAAAKGGTV